MPIDLSPREWHPRLRIDGLTDDQEPESIKEEDWSHAKHPASGEAGDDLLELVTDKASFSLPAADAGRVVRLLAKEGTKVKEEQLMVTLSVILVISISILGCSFCR